MLVCVCVCEHMTHTHTHVQPEPLCSAGSHVTAQSCVIAGRVLCMEPELFIEITACSFAACCLSEG